MLYVTGLLGTNVKAVGAQSGVTTGIMASKTAVATATSPFVMKAAFSGCKQVTQTVLKSMTIVLGLAFLAADMTFLVMDWMKEDAMAGKIQEIVDAINKDVKSLQHEKAKDGL